MSVRAITYLKSVGGHSYTSEKSRPKSGRFCVGGNFILGDFIPCHNPYLALLVKVGSCCGTQNVAIAHKIGLKNILSPVSNAQDMKVSKDVREYRGIKGVAVTIRRPTLRS